MGYLERFIEWKKRVSDEDLIRKLEEIEKDEMLIKNAFYKELEFGTGGMRGEIGAGTNCLNIYTIAKVTKGIAERMKAKEGKSAAVSYDSRINSDLFARVAAMVFASCGITAHITKELMPTPFLSYMTRSLKADIGVMITASHNPAKYNGYKVYGPDGCQLTDEAAGEMTAYINKTDPFEVKYGLFEEYEKQGLIKIAPDSLTESYLNEVLKQRVSDASLNYLSLVYTPLNGAGYKLVPEILKRAGIENIHIVKEQGCPDGNFPTCPFPNPEKKEALALGIKLLEEKSADLLIATDPDGDRLGLAVNTGGGHRLLTGNETGALLADYLFSERQKKGDLPKNPVLVKTIVSSPLAEKIAKKYGAETHNVLTGFKYIGEFIGKLERSGAAERFVLGFEESYGYLAGTYVRDKDAVVAALLSAEMAAFHKKNGKTLAARLEELYKEFGTYRHELRSYEYPGADGSAEMKRLLKHLRENPPLSIGGKKVIKTVDYLTQNELDLPRADVMYFFTDDSSSLIIRPSGTEPLIKMYITVSGSPAENAAAIENIDAFLDKNFKP